MHFHLRRVSSAIMQEFYSTITSWFDVYPPLGNFEKLNSSSMYQMTLLRDVCTFVEPFWVYLMQ